MTTRLLTLRFIPQGGKKPITRKKLLYTELADNETINHLIFFIHYPTVNSVFLFYIVVFTCLCEALSIGVAV